MPTLDLHHPLVILDIVRLECGHRAKNLTCGFRPLFFSFVLLSFLLQNHGIPSLYLALGLSPFLYIQYILSHLGMLETTHQLAQV